MPDSHRLVVSEQLPAPAPVQGSPGAATVSHTDRKQEIDSLDMANTIPVFVLFLFLLFSEVHEKVKHLNLLERFA